MHAVNVLSARIAAHFTCHKGQGIICSERVASEALCPDVHLCEVSCLQHSAQSNVQLPNRIHQFQTRLANSPGQSVDGNHHDSHEQMAFMLQDEPAQRAS